MNNRKKLSSYRAWRNTNRKRKINKIFSLGELEYMLSKWDPRSSDPFIIGDFSEYAFNKFHYLRDWVYGEDEEED